MNTTPKIVEALSTKSDIISRIKIGKVKTMDEAKQFLVETIEDFNKYELTKDECLNKLDQYSNKIIKISKNLN